MESEPNLTSEARSDIYARKFGTLVHHTLNKKYYLDDNSQPSIDEIAYYTVREILWLLAEVRGGEYARNVGDAACETVELSFGDDCKGGFGSESPDADEV